MSLYRLNRICNTEIDKITVIANRGCRIIIKIEPLRDLLYQLPTDKRPIEFGVGISNEPDPPESIYIRAYFEKNLKERTLLIDATKDDHTLERRKKMPTVLLIKVPDGCQVSVQPIK